MSVSVCDICALMPGPLNIGSWNDTPICPLFRWKVRK